MMQVQVREKGRVVGGVTGGSGGGGGGDGGGGREAKSEVVGSKNGVR